LLLLKKLLFFFGYICGIRKKVVIAQLKLCFPDKSEREIDDLVRKIYTELGTTVAEVFVFNDKYFEDKVELEGFEAIDTALGLGRGVIVATAHFGNWELGGKIIAKHHGSLKAIAKSQKNKQFNKYINESREQAGIEVIDMKNALKHIVTALKSNQIVAVLIDQYAHRQGVEMDFLGHKTKTYTSIAQLALKYKTPVIMAFDVRDKIGKHRMTFHEPMIFDSLEFDEQNVLDVTKKINQVLEEYIVSYPHLWFWVHRKWRKLI